MSKIALVTGASSGIGWATAKALSAVGYKLIICGRRSERLGALEQELSTDSYSMVFDVRDREEVENQFANLPDEWKNMEVLINNAGNAHGLSSIQEGSVDDWDAMIDINVKGLLYVTKSVIPGMIDRGSGHVINIGSIAGKEVYPNGNVYCASKHAVDAINNGMRLDLNGTGVKVSQVCPGLVETEFSMVRFKGDQERSKGVYQGYEALKAEDIADIIQFIVTRPAHVNLSDVIVFPSEQASSTIVNKQL